MTELEQLAYRLWCEARAMEDKGNQEAFDPLRNRSTYWFGQAAAFERAAWMVLTSAGVPADAEFFAKTDAARLARITDRK